MVAWAVRTGRAALWEDTGLGKTFQQLEWARLSGDRPLIVAPLAVCQQTVREAAKLGIHAEYIREWADFDPFGDAQIHVTNYERLQNFPAAAFDAVVLDESSILKQSTGATRTMLIDWAQDLLLFKKPGDNAVQIKNDVSNDEWIEWASPIWTDHHDGAWLTEDGHICPVWYGIRETDTLNTKVAKESADERHICPLQLGFIERCVRLWSNPGELVLTPFAGIGSELYQAVKLGRRAIGIELKPSYWRTAVDNLTELESEMEAPSLFDAEALA